MNITSATPLSSRERMNRALTRQPMDRIPRHDSFWEETYDRWMGEGLRGTCHAEALESALEALQSDLACLSWVVPTPFPGRRELVEDQGEAEVVIDEWGEKVRVFKKRSGAPEHLGFACSDREQWEKEFKPRLEAWNMIETREQLRERHARAMQTGRWRFVNLLESWEALRRLIGDEELLYGMIEEPEWIRDMSQTYTDAILRYLDQVEACGVEMDGVWCFGDMAFRTATFCSPEMYRDLVWPDHKRIADWVHARDGKMIYHSDGNVNGVIPDYLEAGFDCLQPLESKAGMDVRTLVPTYGDRLSFCGNIDIMVLATNNREQIEEEIRSKFAAAMPANGYIYHSDHSIPPQVSWETYQFVIDCIDRYGNYG